MTRRFINQDSTSNKFWNITVENKIQTIAFGKVGTKGRELVKEFSSDAECDLETQKLIHQKTKSGYIELGKDDDIPDKAELSENETADIFFWESIKKSNKYRNANWQEYDADEHTENLTELLSKSGKQRLILFEKCLQEKLHELYTAEIAELNIILENDFKNENGVITFDESLSGDGFIYFRCWLLLKGKDFFEGLKTDINTFLSPDIDFNIGNCWAEGLLYVADEAYSINHEDQEDVIRDAVSELYPDIIHYDDPEEMNRDIEQGQGFQKRYPKLVEEIVSIRTNQ
ncbi:putative DNA-binding WGR domain protein [Pedobacter cryoconitis]|uniref:WGR domain-containing protein n=1 Tax=Pedobacter cryoconitis TaxID=188932 RepID=UPI001609400E|nr:DUF4240 domain-containing protein [Pedobacter cryoconitis]MBB6270969.1 putative DNA-binding WGR domain protein [Pedobacter cryoconitis]